MTPESTNPETRPESQADPLQDPACPECGATVALDPGVFEHEILACDDCGVELEVVALDPPRVELAPEVEEDWGE